MQLLRGSLLGDFISLAAVLDEILGQNVLVLLGESPPKLLVESFDCVEWILHQLMVHHVGIVQSTCRHIRRSIGEQLLGHLAHLSAQRRVVPGVLLEVDGVEGLYQRAHGRDGGDWMPMSPERNPHTPRIFQTK